MMKIKYTEKNYLNLNRKEKISFLKNEINERIAKKIFIIESNSYYQKMILRYIYKDKTFLKRIILNDKYHGEIRLIALKNIKENILFYKDIFDSRIIRINKKSYTVPYYSKIFNFCKYKILLYPKYVRFIIDN